MSEDSRYGPAKTRGLARPVAAGFCLEKVTKKPAAQRFDCNSFVIICLCILTAGMCILAAHVGGTQHSWLARVTILVPQAVSGAAACDHNVLFYNELRVREDIRPQPRFGLTPLRPSAIVPRRLNESKSTHEYGCFSAVAHFRDGNGFHPGSSFMGHVAPSSCGSFMIALGSSTT